MPKPLEIMMNLLHAQETLTGTGYYAHYLARAMLALPERPRITGVASPRNYKAFRIRNQPRFRLVKWGRRWPNVSLSRLEEWAFLNTLIADEDPDVFFCPSNFLPLWKTCPMVVTLHDMTFFEHPEGLSATRLIYWQRWTLRTIAVADAIITATESAKRDIVKYGGANPDRITIVPHGTAPRFFIGNDSAGRAERREQLRRRYRNIPDKYVLFLGTLTPHKNVPRLVEAVARARAMGNPDMHLVLGGKRGANYEEIERAISDNNLRPYVSELGYVDDRWMPALYENARVHVLPSFMEGFGLPITEAMACGTPVVTSNCGSMAEVAGDAALLADPHSAEELADCLARLWPDGDLRETMRTRGLARAAEFTWRNAARKTYEVLERVARPQ